MFILGAVWRGVDIRPQGEKLLVRTASHREKPMYGEHLECSPDDVEIIALPLSGGRYDVAVKVKGRRRSFGNGSPAGGFATGEEAVASVWCGPGSCPLRVRAYDTRLV